MSSILTSNEMQIRRGLDLIMNKGVLGFSVKAGRTICERALWPNSSNASSANGYDLRLYDKNLNIAGLVGANRDFIVNRIPHISKLMDADIDAFLTHSQTVVIGNKDPDFRIIPERMRADQVLVDFVRINGRWSEECKYDGICW